MYKVVFAEDEASLRENIGRVIDWEKYEFEIVAMASDGEEAFEAVQRYRPELLITDIRMPFMDGLELCRQAKKIVPMLKIVILSGFSDFGYAQEAIRLGVQDYLVKPITPMKLTEILMKLHAQFEEEKAHKQRYRQMVSDLRAAEERGEPEGTLSMEDMSGIVRAEERLSDFLRMGSQADVGEFVDQLFAFTGERALQSALYRYYFLLKMLGACVTAVEDMNGDPHVVLPQTDDIPAFIGKTVNLDTAKDKMRGCLSAVVAYREIALNTTASMVDQAKSYLEANYASPELSAKQAAEHIGLSPNYFSNIFKQYMGVSFVKYLTGYRMDKAKELLRTTDRTVVEIAELVGYGNANYFSSVFHRMTGMTPLKYRER